MGDQLVIDPTTGEVLDQQSAQAELDRLRRENDELRAQLARAEEQLVLTERELRQKRARISRLEGKRARDWRNSPLAGQIQEVFDAWREWCHHPRAVLDGKRAELIAQRLDEFGSEQLIDAIRGYAAFPYVVEGRRRREGRRDQRYDQLELIMRSAAHVERGLRLAELAEEQPARARRPATGSGGVRLAASPIVRARIVCEQLFGIDHVLGPSLRDLALATGPLHDLVEHERDLARTVRAERERVQERVRKLVVSQRPVGATDRVQGLWFEAPCVACVHAHAWEVPPGVAVFWEPVRRGRVCAVCPAGCSEGRILGGLHKEAKALATAWTADVETLAHLLVVFRESQAAALFDAATRPRQEEVVDGG